MTAPTDSYLEVVSPRTEGVGGPSAGDFGPAYSLPDLPPSVTSVSTGAVFVRVDLRSGTSSPVWPGPASAIALACGLLGPPCPSAAPTRPVQGEGTAGDGGGDRATLSA